MTKIIDANLSSELRKSFIDYGLSVIISRALPDVRDGLKPVHRRILFSMHENGFDKQGPFRKSARVVGDVIGKYHPHGDSAIYDSMVRMAQNFSMAVPLIDGQGNFGSIDGDPAAAMRYTEARMTEAAGFLLQDIDKNTVDFRDNYDGSEREPIVLPARFPNILVNGTEGIAVGMATSIAPHNMSEVLKATLGLLDRPDISVEELASCLEGPDFPTGGIISGREAVRQVYLTGKGTISVRARHHIEDGKRGRRAIVFTEMPYQVNKAKVVEHIGALAAEKKLDGIAEVRDESDREGIRLVVELKADADADAVLARLHKLTALKGTFSQNLLALRDGRPQSMNLKDILEAFLEFRREVVRRRTAWFLRKARARAHIVIGLLMALGAIDKVIAAIKASKTQAEALQSLMSLSLPLRDIEELYRLIETKGGTGKVPARAHLSETQARAILEMRLQRLVGLERDKLAKEASTLIEEINRLVAILREPGELTMVIRRELEEMLALHPGERRTSVEDEVQEISRDILVPRTEEFVTISHQGYVKRVPAARAEKETGDALKDGDFIVRAFAASSRTPLLFFTEKGQAYKISVWQLPEPGPQNRGRPIVNLFDIPTGERIAAVLPCPEERDVFLKTEIAFVTRSGHIRRNALEEFLTVPNGGKMAMKFEDGENDGILDVFVAPEESDVLFLTRHGMALRFPASEIRVFSGRGSKGVRGIKLKDDDEVVSAMPLTRNCAPAEAEAFLALVSKERGLGQEVSNGETVGDLPSERAGELKAEEQVIFTVTENGYARLASAYSYRTAHRGGQGVMDKSRAKKTGALAGGAVMTGNRIVLITERGKTFDVDPEKTRFAARGATGNVIAKPDSGDRITLLSS